MASEEEKTSRLKVPEHSSLRNGTSSVGIGKERPHTPLQSVHSLIQSIRRGDVRSLKKSIRNQTRMREYLYSDEYGVSAAESAVKSGEEFVKLLLDSAHTYGDKLILIQKCLLFAIRDNNIDLVKSLLESKKQIKEEHGRRPPIARNESDVKATDKSIPMLTISEPSIDVDAQEDLDPNGDVDDDSPIVSDCQVSLNERQLPNCDDVSPYSSTNDLRSSTGELRSNTLQRVMSSDYEDADYADTVTPLILAAQLERFEILQLLIDKSNEHMHPLSESATCKRKKVCRVCKEQRDYLGNRTIEDCHQSIELLKALSSPAYILIASQKDPILEAFMLSNFAKRRKDEDNAYSAAYVELDQKCQKFATNLLELCRNTEETELLLNQSRGVQVTNCKPNIRFPRLQLAQHYVQKEFLAHSNCQQILNVTWTEGLPKRLYTSRFSTLLIVLYTILMSFLMPFVFIIYQFPIYNHSFANMFETKWVKAPRNKHTFDLVSYMSFIVLLGLNAFFLPHDPYGTPWSALEWMIFIWLLGMIARFLKMLYLRRSQFKQATSLLNDDIGWAFGEVSYLVCFFIFFILRLVNWLKKEPGPKRPELKGSDELLIAEIFYSIGCLVAIVRILSFFKTHPKLGPLQLSLKKLSMTIVRFLVVFAVIVSAFALAMYHIYYAYGYTTTFEGEKGVRVNSAFTTIKYSYKTLFWSIFDAGMSDHADLLMDKSGKTHTHRATELTGYMLFGFYHVVIVIILANMLIAMVTNAYNDIETNSDVEWKYVRTQLCLSYLNEIGVLPPPFNLWPTRRIILWLKKHCCHHEKRSRRRERENPTMQSHKDKEYESLMLVLKKRYMKTYIRSNKQTTSISVDDINDEDVNETSI